MPRYGGAPDIPFLGNRSQGRRPRRRRSNAALQGAPVASPISEVCFRKGVFLERCRWVKPGITCGGCRPSDLHVASVTDAARLVDRRQEQRAVSSVREPRVSTARIVAVRSRNDPCGFRDLLCWWSSWSYLPSSSARGADKDPAVTVPGPGPSALGGLAFGVLDGRPRRLGGVGPRRAAAAQSTAGPRSRLPASRPTLPLIALVAGKRRAAQRAGVTDGRTSPLS